MSVSEDSDILDEIRDLENVLAKTPAKPKSPQKSFFDVVQEFCENDIISEDPSEPKDSTPDRVTAILNLNKHLIEELKNARYEVSAMLDDCNRKLQIIDEKIKNYSKNWTDNSKVMISAAGMPYFKDKDYFGAPKNEDVKRKISSGELQIVNFQKAFMWTARDRRILLDALYDEVMMTILERTEERDRQLRNMNESSFKNMLSAENVTRIFKEKQFDWLKVSAMTFDNKHTWGECSAMWNILMHPDINKGSWTRKEELRLEKLAKLHRFQDWDQIALKLNTKRTAYQCFIKYNSCGNLLKLIERTWTAKEDERLCNVVAKCRVGNFIPWSKVTSYIDLRSKNQIYFRWTFRLAPHLKKGRFTKAESQTLLEGVNKFGLNFTFIASLLMPSRTSVQLSDHYRTLMSKEFTRHWTISSDLKLINLFKKYGPNWSKIASHFKYKNRTQVRHRYTALLKYASKGYLLREIPRQKNENINESSGEECVEIDEIENTVDDKVDELLLEYFQNLNTNESSCEENLYDSEELSKDTKELYSILESLQADLYIPDNFNYLPLLERDKQLLYSLKAYIKQKYERQNSDEIKALRLKMFGPEDNEELKDHFIPPFPFKVYSNLKKCKQTETIDCAYNNNTKVLVDVETEFNTPELVISLIGGEEEDIKFNKISNLHCFQKDKCEQQNIIRPIDSSNSTMEKPNSPNTNSLLKLTQPNCKIKKNNDLIFKSNAGAYESIREFSNSVTRLNCKQELDNASVPVIMPDYRIILYCRNLLALKSIHDVEKTLDIQENDGDVDKTYKSDRDYKLLKKRLLQLFRYPIIMSYLPLAEIKNTTGSLSTELKNTVCKKRKSTQKNVFSRKKVKKNVSKMLCDNSLSIQSLDKLKSLSSQT